VSGSKYCGTKAYKLEFAAADVGNIHVMGGRAKVFELLAGEDVDSDEVDLGVAMLARLGSGHFDDLARAVLDDDETVLPQSRALHRIRGRGASIGALEGVLLMLLTQCQLRMRGEFSLWQCLKGGVCDEAAERESYLRVVGHDAGMSGCMFTSLTRSTRQSK